MGKIIAVVSGKGGTGKTSFTANVGLALAALGCSTLCLDCDITLRNLDLALGLSDRALMDFTDVIAGRCTLEDAVVQHPKYPKLHLLTAPLSARPVPIAPEQMKALLDRIRQTYDYCLIDAPAGLGMGFHLSSDYADRAVGGTNTGASSPRDFIWWWAGWRRSCCEAFTPPSTTPWTQRVCRCWAWYRRTGTSPMP